jgi:hypothetical protein
VLVVRQFRALLLLAMLEALLFMEWCLLVVVAVVAGVLLVLPILILVVAAVAAMLILAFLATGLVQV